MSTNNDITVTNNEDAGQFEANVDGQLAVAVYELEPDTIIFTHTEVPEALEGEGIASELAHTALDYAREHNLAVVPQCPFIASYIKRHSEYQALVKRNA